MEILTYIPKPPSQPVKRAPRAKKVRSEEEINIAYKASLLQKQNRYKNDEDFRIKKRVEAIVKILKDGGKIKKEATIVWYNQAVRYLEDSENNPKPSAELQKNNPEKIKAQLEKIQAKLEKLSV